MTRCEITKIVTVTARDMIARLQQREEIAFLDLREAGPFSEAHPLLSRLGAGPGGKAAIV